MKVIVDADACPVKEIICNVAAKYNVPVIMVCDTSHIISNYNCKVITVDKSADSADIFLINITDKADLVISQDYGVAAMALGKGAYALNNFGYEYTNENIDQLLFERFLGKKVRKAGGRTLGPKKRTVKDNEDFEVNFEKILIKILDTSA